MIEFMVIAGERSGSTWAANWLTTDTTLCIHDPLMRYTLDELDTVRVGYNRIGIACTAFQLYPRWLNMHRAKKVIVHREVSEIETSWSRLGVTGVTFGTENRLNQIDGLHCPYTDLFDAAAARHIAAYLGVPFSEARHAELVQMNVQPHWLAVNVTRRGVEQLTDRIRKTLGQ